MNSTPDAALLKSNFVGTLHFLPDDQTAVCELEFVRLDCADLVAVVSMKDLDWEFSDELLLCPDGEQRFRSKKDVYVTGTSVQLLIHRDKLTLVVLDTVPHLRVVGEWIGTATDDKGRERKQWWAFEGLLKQGHLTPALRLNPGEVGEIRWLQRHWREVCE